MIERMRYFTCSHSKCGKPKAGVNCWPVKASCPHKHGLNGRNAYLLRAQDCELCSAYNYKKEISIYER